MKNSFYFQKSGLYSLLLISLIFRSIILEGQERLIYSDNDFRTPHDLLRSSSLDGEDIDTLCQNDGSPLEIEFSETTNKLYWISSFEGRNTSIKCANSDGSDVMTLISGLPSINDIDIDDTNSKIYWSYRSGKYIKRANLDGTDIEDVLTDVFSVSWIDVVSGQNKIYWLQNQPGDFCRANLDGSEVETLFTIPRTNCMMSIHVNESENKIYWVNICDKVIQKADLDGSNVVDVRSVFSYYTYEIINFRIDGTNNKIYWAEDQKICRSNLDGSGYSTILNTENGNYSMAMSSGNNAIFWTNSSDEVINKCSLTGSGFQELLKNTIYKDGYGLAVDYINNQIYWAGQGGSFGKCEFDGSNSLQILNGDYYPQGDIAIDYVGRKIYWANVQQSIIQRTNLDGSNVENLINTSAFGIDLDLNERKLYWTEYETAGKIKRSNLNGSNMEEVISTGIENPKIIKLDLQNKKMYWTAGSTLIQRADLDGSNIEDLVSSGLEYPRALALDIANGKMYWSETGTYSNPVGIIRKANLDGSQIEIVNETGIIRCNGISVLAMPTITQLISPIDGITKYPSDISFSWTIGNNAGTYHLQISSDKEFSDFTVDSSDIIENSFSLNYISEGKYYWRVATENSIGKTIWSESDSFLVLTPPPSANFSCNNTSGILPLTVDFTNNSTGDITEWFWDFGDGSTSTEQNPIHEYVSAGVYTVSLTVTGNGGSDTKITSNYISVFTPAEVDFSCDYSSGIEPFVVHFIDNSKGDISQWAWDFGDGNTSSEQNPTHEYTAAGVYTVTLTVTGDGGIDSEAKTDYISVSPNSILFSEAERDLNIYPNPARTSIIVELSLEKSDDIEIKIFDGQGQIIRSDNFGALHAEKHNFEMNVSDLPNGLYYISVTTDSYSSIQKLMINR